MAATAIAVLIGVSTYKSPQFSALPACARDVASVASLLRSMNKYADILVVEDSIPAASVKEQLAAFIAKHRGGEVSEVLFYFTGHGLVRDDEFYFVLGDYDESRRRQTSLEHTEVDALLRSLSAAMTVKIVDACHSGKSYIKDPEWLKGYIGKGIGAFRKCYFLYSSQSDQSSYADHDLSDFTRSLLGAAEKRRGAELRYKDAIDVVSDDFDGRGYQRPLFVVQADFIEIWGQVPSDWSAAASPSNPTAEAPPKDTKDLPLVEIVRLDAERYATKAQVEEMIAAALSYVKSYKNFDDFDALFDVVIEPQDAAWLLPGIDEVAAWLHANAASSEFMVTVNYTQETRVFEVPAAMQSGSIAEYVATLAGTTPVRKETRVVDVPSNFISTAKIKPEAIVISANPRFPNVQACKCFIVFVVSKTTVRVFFGNQRLRESGWDTLVPESNPQWTGTSFGTRSREQMEEAMSAALDFFGMFALDRVEKRFLPDMPAKPGDTEANSGNGPAREPPPVGRP